MQMLCQVPGKTKMNNHGRCPWGARSPWGKEIVTNGSKKWLTDTCLPCGHRPWTEGSVCGSGVWPEVTVQWEDVIEDGLQWRSADSTGKKMKNKYLPHSYLLELHKSWVGAFFAALSNNKINQFFFFF